MRPLLTYFIAVTWARAVIAFFVRLGLLGPFLLEVLHSSFFYVPLANEFLLFALISREGGGRLWMGYALAAALGSVAGVFLLDRVARGMGEQGMERFVRPGRFRSLKRKLEGRTWWVIFLAGLMPPPFPFRVTVVAASALQTPRAGLLTAVFCGRLVRFAAEALLLLYFGRRFLDYLSSDAVEYAVYAMVCVAAAGSVLVIYKLYGGRARAAAGARGRKE